MRCAAGSGSAGARNGWSGRLAPRRGGAAPSSGRCDRAPAAAPPRHRAAAPQSATTGPAPKGRADRPSSRQRRNRLPKFRWCVRPDRRRGSTDRWRRAGLSALADCPTSAAASIHRGSATRPAPVAGRPERRGHWPWWPTKTPRPPTTRRAAGGFRAPDPERSSPPRAAPPDRPSRRCPAPARTETAGSFRPRCSASPRPARSAGCRPPAATPSAPARCS